MLSFTLVLVPVVIWLEAARSTILSYKENVLFLRCVESSRSL